MDAVSVGMNPFYGSPAAWDTPVPHPRVWNPELSTSCIYPAHKIRDVKYQGHALNHKSQVIPNTRRNTGISAACCIFGWHRGGCNAWECLQRERSPGELFMIPMGRAGDEQWADPWLRQAEGGGFAKPNAMRSAPSIPPGHVASQEYCRDRPTSREQQPPWRFSQRGLGLLISDWQSHSRIQERVLAREDWGWYKLEGVPAMEGFGTG